MLALLGSPAPAVPEPPVEAIVTRHQELREFFLLTDCFCFACRRNGMFTRSVSQLWEVSFLGKSSEVVIAERLFAKLTALIWKISHSNLDFLEFIAQFVSVCKII